MIVLDADSLMSGETLVKMVETMETNPNVGILQTVPIAIGHHTLLARFQQFANHLYGPMFAAGMHYWQLGDAHYWGHNAIIQVAPFMAHCGLQRLPGKPPLGGDILSHDFVEAALIRRAGWSVWLAYDLKDSWEEIPPNLIDELSRDRRWCQGNLQHLRLIFSQGIFPAHRLLFLNGAMAYFSALLWFIFITLSTVKAILEVILPPVYFPNEAPRSKLRGIKAELRRSPYPPSLYRASTRFTLPFIPAASSRVSRRRRMKEAFSPTGQYGSRNGR
jgi:membrane glycosyltransferase